MHEKLTQLLKRAQAAPHDQVLGLFCELVKLMIQEQARLDAQAAEARLAQKEVARQARLDAQAAEARLAAEIEAARPRGLFAWMKR